MNNNTEVQKAQRAQQFEQLAQQAQEGEQKARNFNWQNSPSRNTQQGQSQQIDYTNQQQENLNMS